jgi:DNA-directed RNA polymerase specialized sigma24 family protein
MPAPVPETMTLIDDGLDRTSEADRGALEPALEVFLTQRTRLFRIAHRVTGDVGSAEDVVQEAWLRWQRTDRGAIKNPAAFLTTTTTHLAINIIQSARHRHESPTEWPLADLAAGAEDPVLGAERTAVVEETLLVLMARLSPAELAAYLLRKGFDYTYGDIAALLHTSAANSRQLVRRAQQRIDGDRERPVAGEDHRRLVSAFQMAARTGELAALETLLTRATRPSTRPHERPAVRPAHRAATPRVA